MNRIRSGVALAAAMSLALSSATVGAQDVDVAASFDAATEELPEGLGIDRRGDMYVTMGLPFFIEAGDGWIKKVSVDGSVDTLATFDDGAPAGIVTGPDGEVYYARPNPGIPESRGVYRLHEDGVSERLPGTEEMLIANGLAIDGLGSLYATDSATGVIWRVALDGSTAQPWFADPELTGGCGGDDEVGPNGIALRDGHVYVGVTSRGLVVQIPVLDDGSAGEAVVVAGDDSNGCAPDALFGMDGIAFDDEGRIYATLVLQHKLVRIDPVDGSIEILLDESDGLHNPASLAFGTTDGDRSSLYITNYAVLPPAPTEGPGPAVLRVDVGVDGSPLP